MKWRFFAVQSEHSFPFVEERTKRLINGVKDYFRTLVRCVCVISICVQLCCVSAAKNQLNIEHLNKSATTSWSRSRDSHWTISESRTPNEGKAVNQNAIKYRTVADRSDGKGRVLSFEISSPGSYLLHGDPFHSPPPTLMEWREINTNLGKGWK